MEVSDTYHPLLLKFQTSWNEFSKNIALAVIYLATNQKFNFSKLIFDGMLRNLDNPKMKFLMYPRFLMVFLNNQIKLGKPFNDAYTAPAYNLKVFLNMSRKRLKFLGKITPLFPNMLIQAECEGSGVPTKPQPTPFPTLPSTEDQPPVTESSSIHDTTQDSRDSLDLEGSCFGNYQGCLGYRDDCIKGQDKEARKEVTFEFDLDDDHGIDYMDTEEPVNEGRLSKETKELVSTARLEDSTVRPDVGTADTIALLIITTSIFNDEDIIMDQTFIKLKEEKVKEKGMPIKDIKDSSRPTRSVLTLKPLLTINPKDKRKGVLEEPRPTKKMTRSDLDAAQIAKDAEVARLVYEEELSKLEREKEKRQREKEASKATIAKMYDDVQAGIKANELFTAKLQQEEREEYTIEKRAKFLAETIVAQRKFRAAQRSVKIRSRPPTKSQLRNLMMTYLKNMGGYKHSQLKVKSLEEIQGLYERQKRLIDDFKPMDSDDAVDKKKVLKEPDSTKIEVKQEGDKESIRKIPSKRLKMKATKKSKRQKTDSDFKEEEHLKTFLFDRIDLEELYNLVMQRFEIISPEGVDLVLWGDLRTMFEETANDDL
nr:hypothetical protein [Tanacetum cinerariifolium]